MAKFLAIYTGTPMASEIAKVEGRVDEEAGMKAWGEWMEAHAASIVDSGGPLGKTKKVSRDGIADISNTMAAYVIVEAPSHEAAAKMFEGHAHFTLFPGEGVEIMPVLEMPGM